MGTDLKNFKLNVTFKYAIKNCSKITEMKRNILKI